MKRAVILTVIVLGATLLAAGQNNQTPLGDVVKRPKPTKKAAHVYTNDEIPSRPEEPSQPAAADKTGSGTAAGNATGPAASDTTAKTEAKAATGKEDSPEVSAIKARLKEVETDELNLSSTIKDIEAVLGREEDSSRRDVLNDMLKNQKSSLSRRQAERAELRGKLDQAQSETKN
jgi:hypothetical protein